MKRFFLATFLLAVCNISFGQGFMKKLLKKGDKEAVELDTMTITLDKGVTFYPCTNMDGSWTVVGFTDFAGKTSECIFVNSLLYAIEQAERGKEHILLMDVDKKSFSLLLNIPSSFYPETSTFYKYANSFKVVGDNLSFAATELHVCYKPVLSELKELRFESLQPEKKAKHKNYMNECAAENSKFLYNMFQFIRENKPEKVTHWNEIANGEIMKGMNVTECLLAVGKPMHIRENASQTKWMVNNDFVVIFENGIVVNVIR